MTNLAIEQKSALCAAIRTTRYARNIVTLLRDLAADLYKTDHKEIITVFENTFEEQLLVVFKDIFTDIDSKDLIGAEETFKTIIAYLNSLEEIEFIIPMQPNPDFISQLHSWCMSNISSGLLLDFTVNRLMDSGLYMVYKGHYFSYSLDALLSDYFKEHNLNKYFEEEEALVTNEQPF